MKRKVKELISEELLNHVKVKKEPNFDGSIQVTGLLEIVK
jgi:hypothetical protein